MRRFRPVHRGWLPPFGSSTTGSFRTWPVSTATTLASRAISPLVDGLPDACDGRCARGLTPNAGGPNHALRFENCRVRHRGDRTVGQLDRAHAPVIRRRVPDPDRGRNRLGACSARRVEARLERLVERRRPCGLDGQDSRQAIDEPETMRFVQCLSERARCCQGCPREAQSSPAPSTRAAGGARTRSISAPRSGTDSPS